MKLIEEMQATLDMRYKERSNCEEEYKDFLEGEIAALRLSLIIAKKHVSSDIPVIAHQLEYAFPDIPLARLSDIIEYFRPYLREPKRESGEHAKTKDLVNLIRMKLERRFQVADYLLDGFQEDPPARAVVTDVCQDVMAHVREIHALAERALNNWQNANVVEAVRIADVIDRFWQLHSIEPATGFTPEQLAKEICK